MERIALLYAALHQLRDHSDWDSVTFNIPLETGDNRVILSKDSWDKKIQIKISSMYGDLDECSSDCYLDDLFETWLKGTNFNK